MLPSLLVASPPLSTWWFPSWNEEPGLTGIGRRLSASKFPSASLGPQKCGCRSLDLGCRYELCRYELSPLCPDGIWAETLAESCGRCIGLGIDVVGGCETKSRRRPCRMIPGTGESFEHLVSQNSVKSSPTTLLKCNEAVTCDPPRFFPLLEG
jgi:hypothetical protein